MRETVKSHKASLCYTCLVRAKCNRLCRDQAGIMVDNLTEYFFEDIQEIIRKHGTTRKEKITLVVACENTYDALSENNLIKDKLVEV